MAICHWSALTVARLHSRRRCQMPVALHAGGRLTWHARHTPIARSSAVAPAADCARAGVLRVRCRRLRDFKLLCLCVPLAPSLPLTVASCNNWCARPPGYCQCRTAAMALAFASRASTKVPTLRAVAASGAVRMQRCRRSYVPESSCCVLPRRCTRTSQWRRRANASGARPSPGTADHASRACDATFRTAPRPLHSQALRPLNLNVVARSRRSCCRSSSTRRSRGHCGRRGRHAFDAAQSAPRVPALRLAAPPRAVPPHTSGACHGALRPYH